MILLQLLLASNIAMAAEPLEKLQWGLKNTGENQSLELDHITTFRVQGRAGEDLKIPATLKIPAKKVIVAVLDTGIDHMHPDLKNVLVRKESECKALAKFEACVKDKDRKSCEKIWMDLSNPEVDQDKNGYPLDCSGWTVLGGVNAANVMGRPDFNDDQGHGTHVAGIIAADSSNSLGIRGASANVQILPVQVLGNAPTEPIKPLSVTTTQTPPQTAPPPPGKKPGTPGKDPLAGPIDITPTEKGKESFKNTLGDYVARGVLYAINSGAQVINFSLGWPESNDSAYLRKVIEEAQKRGIIIVAAAGNDSTRALLRPCSYKGVICVASHAPDGSLSHFSNYGSGVDIAAPGTQILSTYPMSKRPVRFRQSMGFEFLHGTSQASPYVAGLVAEMIAQGIPKDEIYPRLVLGARNLQESLPLLQGAAHKLQEDGIKANQNVEKKFILSGPADLSKSLALAARPFLLPTMKEKTEITWNRTDSTLKANFEFENLWSDVDMSQIALQATFLKTSKLAVRPTIRSLGFSPNTGAWKKGEKRILELSFEITDTAIPAETRIPSELDLALIMTVAGNTQKMVLESEIIIPVDETFQDLSGKKIVESIAVNNMPQMRASLIAIEENLDGVPRSDYLAFGVESKVHHYFLMKQDKNHAYEPQGVLKVSLTEGKDSEKTEERILSRIPFKGASNYAIGLFVDRSADEKAFSSLKLFHLDSSFKILRQFEVQNQKVQIPSKVYWQGLGTDIVPSWVGRGFKTEKKRSVRDDWENPEGNEEPKLRFYYLDLNSNIKSISDYQGYQFMDVLEPSVKQIKSGRVPVLMAKNRGTDTKPSYLYDFAAGEVKDGKIVSFNPVDLTLNKQVYRNLLDTRIDKVHSLDKDLENSRGTFWFGEGPVRSQRLSMLVPDQSFKEFDYFDQNLSSTRGVIDAALWIRAAFFGKNQAGAFALTNSEIQYHDVLNNKVLIKSLERYTFYSDMAFTNLHFPITLDDSKNGGQKIPALFTTENSGFSRGVKFKAAVKDDKGQLVEIMSPAKLRFKSGVSCKPLDNPVVTTDGSTALDYYCGKKILRMKLQY